MPTPTHAWILPLTSDDATLPVVGGKGANLARLARAGFPVPPAFLVTTHAYEAFVAGNGLDAAVALALPRSLPDDPAAAGLVLDSASARIRALFAAAVIPPSITAALLSAYAGLGRPPVAVRSSATAEDLPDLSFAGQQDTFLNVTGDEALLRRVADCWGSLWTARAIGYRMRNGVPHAGAALAVVVQQMVESQASGVLFTANPLTGLRTETVIDATIGLGEALVSGQVEPDHYAVDAAGRIIERTVGAKALSVRSLPGGGTQTIAEKARDLPALPDDALGRLAALGREVAALYGAPQDVEWAWAEGALYLLQSRPVTSLFPVPEGMPPEPLHVLLSFGAIQGMLDPITPLGRDVLYGVFAACGRLFGRRLTPETQTALFTAGERLWVNLTPFLRNPIGRRVVPVVLAFGEPAAQSVIAGILDDPRLRPGRHRIGRRAALQFAGFLLPVAGNVALNLLAPDHRRSMILANGERLLASMSARMAALPAEPHARLAALLDLWSGFMAGELPRTFRLFVSGIASGMASFNLVRTLGRASAHTGAGSSERPVSAWSDDVLQITRGIPHNPTTEMDLALWRLAQDVRRDPPSLAAFAAVPGADLAARYQDGALPPVLQSAVAGFLEIYGARGLAEFDAGRPRWSEDPRHIFSVLSAYLQIQDPDAAPDVVFARGAQAASAAAERLAAAVRRSPRGWLKAHLLRFAVRRARALMAIRESPKFFAVRMFGLLRRELLSIGAQLASMGELERTDDVVCLSLAELAELAREGAPRSDDFTSFEAARAPVAGRIAARRAAYDRELRRRQVPRLLLSDGRAFYAGIAADESSGADTLAGSPVSPGVVEGRVRVVLDPRGGGLQPGEVLVCPGTDPSWTPLFLAAAALVTEVGGMMTHGAVVAREYGIPAVVGVDRATTRLRTGQRVRVDGSSGRIGLLPDPVPMEAAAAGA